MGKVKQAEQKKREETGKPPDLPACSPRIGAGKSGAGNTAKRDMEDIENRFTKIAATRAFFYIRSHQKRVKRISSRKKPSVFFDTDNKKG